MLQDTKGECPVMLNKAGAVYDMVNYYYFYSDLYRCAETDVLVKALSTFYMTRKKGTAL